MTRTRTVAGRQVDFDRGAVEAAVSGVLPDPLKEHWVAVAGRRFPPKQVLELVTGIDRADFTTHQARRLLQRLGFSVGRVADPPAAGPPPPPGLIPGGQAERLWPYRGRWIAQLDGEVLVHADAPLDVVRWLNEHGIKGASVFRVPMRESDTETLIFGR